jgi:hypothetical protein
MELAMTEEQQKEQFSIAYIHAVAAVARVNIYRFNVDQDSIDIGFSERSIAGNPQSPRIEAQIKCVTELTCIDSNWRYPLKIKNYNELIGRHYIPKILIVVLVPSALQDWVRQTEDSLSLYKCGYWVSLSQLSPSVNETNVTVSIPRASVFSPDALRQLIQGGVV